MSSKSSRLDTRPCPASMCRSATMRGTRTWVRAFPAMCIRMSGRSATNPSIGGRLSRRGVRFAAGKGSGREDLFEQYNNSEDMDISPEVDREYAEIARERTRRHPLRTYILLPMQRALTMVHAADRVATNRRKILAYTGTVAGFPLECAGDWRVHSPWLFVRCACSSAGFGQSGECRGADRTRIY